MLSYLRSDDIVSLTRAVIDLVQSILTIYRSGMTDIIRIY